MESKNIKVLAPGIIFIVSAAIFQGYPVLYFLNILTLLFLMVWAIVKVAKSAKKGGRKYFTPYASLCVLILIAFTAKITDTKFHWIDLVDLKISSQKYETCETSGVSFDADDRISVCKRSDWDRWGFIEVVLYDSSDQIALPSSNQSIDWRRAAMLLSKRAPFGELGFTVWHLSGHFYLVRFAYDARPNF